MIEPRSLAEHLANARLRVRSALAAAIAQRSGPPPMSVRLTLQQQRERWYYRDPSVDPAKLAAEGRTAAEIAMALYPYRLPLLRALGPKAADWVAYAERMQRLGPPEGQAQPAPEEEAR